MKKYDNIMDIDEKFINDLKKNGVKKNLWLMVCMKIEDFTNWYGTDMSEFYRNKNCKYMVFLTESSNVFCLHGFIEVGDEMYQAAIAELSKEYKD
tara:strand:- start:24221 stop:24505 length:285 start_codon:yes stop_codon:yes gene_type:complete